jgi:hypothetical protein
MNRRGFLKAVGVAAPAVILTPGLLMPVRKLWTPDVLFTQSGTGSTPVGTLMWFMDPASRSGDHDCVVAVIRCWDGTQWLQVSEFNASVAVAHRNA